MSDRPTLYSVDEWNVNFFRPVLIGPNRWSIPNGEGGDEVFTFSDDDALKTEIHKCMDRAAKLEAVRRAREDVDACVVYDRANELALELYGVSLETFDRNGGKIHTRALFLMAQRELAREEMLR